MKRARTLLFLAVMSTTAFSLVALAQPKKPATTPVKKPGAKPLEPDEGGVSRGDAGPMAGREEKAQPTATSKDAGKGGEPVESKTLDGGQRVFRFGEVEVEGRLKSPQIVYFLRRVRAEFAAGDLGHRSFMREMSETKNEPSF